MSWTPTPTPAEPPTIIDAGGQPAVVREGPAWLAGLLYGPPWWVVWALGAVLGLVGLVVLYQSRHVDGPAQWASLARTSTERVALVICIAAVTMLSSDYAGLPYLGDVAVGLAGGYALGTAIGPAAGRAVESLLWDHFELEVDADE